MAWVIQQLREAMPFGQQPSYLFRDNDGIYGDEVGRFLVGTGIAEVKTAHRCPWQNPFVERCRMRRHSKMHDLATGMIEDHKDVQELKANSRHREEVHGPRHFEVISQEGQPSLRLVRSSLMLDHILPDGVWAGWIETE